MGFNLAFKGFILKIEVNCQRWREFEELRGSC